MFQSNQHDSPAGGGNPLTPIERNQKRKQFWAEVYAKDREQRREDLIVVEEAHPLRVMVAARVVREIARLKQVIFDNEPMCELLENPDFLGWIEPLDPPEDMRGLRGPEEWIAKADIPLLPPAPGSEWESTLPTYFEAFRLAYQRLGLHKTQDGPRGFRGLTDVERYIKLWPSLEEILGWENSFLHTILAAVSQNGSLLARRFLREKHGLRRWEEDIYVTIATQGAVELMSRTVEEDRAVMLLRLEDFVRRAKGLDTSGVETNDVDLRAELAALKLISDIQNLRTAKPADQAEEMAEVVRDIEKKVEQKEKRDGRAERAS